MSLITNTFMSDEDMTDFESGFHTTTIPAYRYSDGLDAEHEGVRFGRSLAYNGDNSAENTRLQVLAALAENLRGDDPEFAARELARLVRAAVSGGYAADAAEAIAALDDFAPSAVLAQRAWTKVVSKAIEETTDFGQALLLMAENPGVLDASSTDNADVIETALADEAELDEMMIRSAVAEGRLGKKVEIRKDADQIRRVAKALAHNGDIISSEKGVIVKGKSWTLTCSPEGLIVWAEKHNDGATRARRANPTRKGGKAGANNTRRSSDARREKVDATAKNRRRRRSTTSR
jgi:hypothetical protein